MKHRFAKLFSRDRLLTWISPALCFLSLFSFDFSLRFIYRFSGNTALLAPVPLGFTALWSLLLTLLCCLLPRLPRRIVMGFLGALFAFLCWLHGVMFNIFGHFFTFSDMSFAGEGARFFSWSYFELRKLFLLLLACSLGLMVAAIVLAKKPLPGARPWKGRLAVLAVSLACTAGLFGLHQSRLPKADTMWWGATFNPAEQKEVYRDFTDSNRSLMLTGLYQYTFRNFTVSFGIGAERQNTQALDEFFEERALSLSGPNDMSGALQGKNLMMVMLESIDTWLVTPEYMPNLYRVTQEGVDFTRFYTPLYLSAGTFTTEIVSQTGLIPATSGLSSSAYSTNSFPLSLANLFEEQGYIANSFHSASPAIYSRGSIHTNLGFEAYHSYVDMGMDDYQLDSQMLRGYDLMISDTPFFTYIITYSGHGPYTGEMGNISAPHEEAARAAVESSGVTGSEADMAEYREAVAHAMETDAFIGGLLDKLEADGLLEDTVLLFYADHYGKYLTNTDFIRQLKGISGSSPDLYRTPCVLYGGGLEPAQIDKVCGSVDLVPTLVNLFDLPADPKYYIGDDIFGEQGGVVMLPNAAWYDGDTYYTGAAAAASDREKEITAQVARRVNASMDVLRCNYFSLYTPEE